MSAGSSKRIESLDYLRGLLAVAVMLYHYSHWTSFNYPSAFGNLIQCLGIYAVSSFYILSGISLAIVYGQKQLSKRFLNDFIIKRFFRIAPLYWFASILSLIYPIGRWLIKDDSSKLVSIKILAFNFSLLFGWLQPNAYVAVGGWSIGNELVFYSIFPFLLLAWKRSRVQFAAVFLLCIGIAWSFAVHLYMPEKTLDDQWSIYINPFNQLFLFAGGVAIGLFRSEYSFKLHTLLAWVGLGSCIAIFSAFDTSTSRLDLVTGWPRGLLSISCFVVCFVATFWKGKHNPLLARGMELLGITSYSIYLLHPFVYNFVNSLNFRLLHLSLPLMAITIAVPATVIVSFCSYHMIEKPFMNLASQITKRQRVGADQNPLL